MVLHTPRELLLRAVLHYRRAKVVAHTVELSSSLVFVQTHCHAQIGEHIRVELSFPGLVSPFSLETQVIAHRMQMAPGEPCGLVLGFLFYSERERELLQQLLVDAPTNDTASECYNVLVVEDNDFIRDAFAFGVGRLPNATSHLSVDMVSDSRDVLERLSARSYDLAIVDYFLPTDNGDRLISTLRSDSSLCSLPIFVFSAGGADIRRAALDAGADMFLQKPVIIRSLFPTIVHLSALAR